MAIRKKIESRKAVEINYLRIASFSFSQSGNVTIRVMGYKDGEAFLSGAEPIDEYECGISNADISLKTPFYEILEQFPLFHGAEKDLVYSSPAAGTQILTVQTQRGDLIMREVVNMLGASSQDGTDVPELEPENGAVDADVSPCQDADIEVPEPAPEENLAPSLEVPFDEAPSGDNAAEVGTITQSVSLETCL